MSKPGDKHSSFTEEVVPASTLGTGSGGRGGQVHTLGNGSLPNEEGAGCLHINSQHPLPKETN